MLASCANPSCSSKFRYLHQGKLFVFNARRDQAATSDRVNFAGQIDRRQYAWLCDECTAKFEVVLDAQDQIKLRERSRIRGVAAAAVAATLFKVVPAIALACDLGEIIS